ncbi:TonB-dependent receptor plug domain-containing protein, partial [Myxococcota bacterium]|nr:TonB-dependent receptor plug domain-containing protein [Myxococcota bacterium]
KSAALQWKFEPALLDGKPVPAKIPVAYPFRLKHQGVKKTPVKDPPAVPLKKPATKPVVPPVKPLVTRPPVPKPLIPPKPATTTPQPGTARIGGTIWQKGSVTRIEDARVITFKRKPGGKAGVQTASTYSDKRGRFSLSLAPGRYVIKVLAPGCLPHETTETLAPDKTLEVDYFIRRREDDPYATTVVGKKDRKEVTRYEVTLPEILAIPGTQGDALKAIQNMPGVARSTFGMTGLVIRGASPRDSKIFFEGHEIPQLYHFFGITSVINSDMLKSIEFVPGNFSPEYGTAMGGVVNVRARKPKTDGLHGYLDADLWDAGLLLEGPLPWYKGGSFAVTYRRSYLDAFLRPYKDRVGVAPIYHDYMALMNLPLLGGTLQAMFFGSQDSIVLFEENMEPYVTNFMKGLLIYSRRVGKTDYKASLSAGESYLEWKDPDGEFKIGYTIRSVDYRTSVRHRFTEAVTLRGGINGGFAEIDLWIRMTSTVGKDENGQDIQNPLGNQRFDLNERLYGQAAWAELQYKPFKWLEVLPGIRFDFWDGIESREVTTNPRLTTIFHIVPKKLRLMAALGLYTQPPDLFMTHKDFGNPDLSYESSIHSSLGMEWTATPETSLKLVGFYKHLYDLVASPVSTWNDDGDVEPDARLATNHGVGRIYGMEVLLKKNNTNLCPGFMGFQKCFGWLSYTLMKSERKDKSQVGWYPFDYDQTHILTGILSGKWANGWQVGLRFRFTSGNPTTPFAGGIYSIDANAYYGMPGVRNSGRLPDFHQLDFRVDKKFTFNRWSFTLYLDIQNLYNQQTSEYVMYNFNYTRKGYVHGLPVLPSLGFKGSF